VAHAQKWVTLHHAPGKAKLVRCVGKVICAANDVRNTEIDIVDHYAQVIGGMAVGAQENEILQFRVGELTFPKTASWNEVLPAGGIAKRRAAGSPAFFLRKASSRAIERQEPS
jgi:hypothetical protein